ncbi:IS21 family transposase [uncultured Parasutterella sp.]|nr:IS21 family transposase [uncultured Parasutterella sp.]
MEQSSMEKIKKIAALLNLNQPYSKIAASVSVSKSTVSKYANQIKASGLTYTEIEKTDSAVLEELLCSHIDAKYREIDTDHVITQLANVKYATRQLLYEAYKASDPSSACSYPTFCRQIDKAMKAKAPKEVYTNLERVPGGSMEIDFAGELINWVDKHGKSRKSKLFVATMTFSQKMFACAFDDEKQHSWMQGIVKALEFFGGIPKTLIVDNARSLVMSHKQSRIDYSPILTNLCEYYRINTFACRPRSPKGKNRVENSVLHFYRHVIAPLSMQGPIRAFDLSDLNEQILEKVRQFNERPFTKNRQSSREIEFAAHEKKALASLPILAFEVGSWKYLKVDKGHCIRLTEDCGHRYSVPASHVGKRVSVLKTAENVFIYDIETAVCIGKHKRLLEASGQKTHILPEHLTAKEKHQRLSKDEWAQELIDCGYNESTVVNVLEIKWESDQMNARRFCSCLRRLAKIGSIRLANEALGVALEQKFLSYSFIENFVNMRKKELLMGLDNSDKDQDYRTVEHENIRNNYS